MYYVKLEPGISYIFDKAISGMYLHNTFHKSLIINKVKSLIFIIGKCVENVNDLK